MIGEPQAPQLIDNASAPEVFAAFCTGFASFGPNITLTFEAPRVDHSTDPGLVSRHVVLRVTIPQAGAQGLVVGLNAYLEEHGLSPSQAVSGGQTSQ